MSEISEPIEPKPKWVNPYEGEILPLEFRTRGESAEYLTPEEISAICVVGIGIVYTKEIGKKMEDLLWEDW